MRISRNTRMTREDVIEFIEYAKCHMPQYISRSDMIGMLTEIARMVRVIDNEEIRNLKRRLRITEIADKQNAADNGWQT